MYEQEQGYVVAAVRHSFSGVTTLDNFESFNPPGAHRSLCSPDSELPTSFSPHLWLFLLFSLLSFSLSSHSALLGPVLLMLLSISSLCF